MIHIGKKIGRIRIVESLGRGGMGEVYVGYDEKLERKVAIKSLRGERLLEPEAKARFLHEARILSQLDHPQICKIFDVLEDYESDYLILEFIDGRTLEEALRDGVSVNTGIRIARKVADALVAAHAEGVVHRDLKPGNIMIAFTGDVRVLDFGLALTMGIDQEALQLSRIADVQHHAFSELPDDSVLFDSETGYSLGTLHSMNSARAGSLLLEGTSTRNIHSFGSILKYPDSQDDSVALTIRTGPLAGTPRYMSPEQALRREGTPASDVYSFGLILQEIFSKTPPYELTLSNRELISKVARGDTQRAVGARADILQLIEAMKSRNPSKRPTAADVRERLVRISDRTNRRIRWGLGVAFIIVALISSIKYTVDLRNEREQAIAARIEAEKAREESEQVNKLLVDIFAVSDPDENKGLTITARELLDRGFSKIILLEQPDVQARLMITIGRGYRNLGLHNSALRSLNAAVDILNGADKPALLVKAEVLSDLGSANRLAGNLDLAEENLKEAVGLFENCPDSCDRNRAESLMRLGTVTAMKGGLKTAEDLFAEALKICLETIGENDPLTSSILNNLGSLNAIQSKFARADNYFTRSLNSVISLYGEVDHRVAQRQHNLGILNKDLGQYEKAISYIKQALNTYTLVYGEKHPKIASAHYEIGDVLRLMKSYAESEEYLKRSLEMRAIMLGKSHFGYGEGLIGLARLRVDLGDTSHAVLLFQEAIEIFENSGARGEITPDAIAKELANALRQGGYEEETNNMGD